MAFGSDQTTSLADAKAHFAEYVRRVERGQSILLTRHGRPVARIVPLTSARSPDGTSDRTLDSMRSEIREGQGEFEAHPLESLSNRRVRRAALDRFLEDEVWPQIPEKMIGRAPTKKEREEILGTNEDGE